MHVMQKQQEQQAQATEDTQAAGDDGVKVYN